MAPKGNTALYRDKKKNAVSKKIKSAKKRLHEQGRSKQEIYKKMLIRGSNTKLEITMLLLTKKLSRRILANYTENVPRNVVSAENSWPSMHVNSDRKMKFTRMMK